MRVTSCLLVPNIVRINIFSEDLCLWRSRMVRGRFPHMYKETGKITALCTVF